MLQHRADRRTVATGIAIVALGIVPYAVHPTSAWALAWVPLAAVLSLSAWSIVHNQIHCRIFSRDALNTIWSAWIALAVGHPPTSLVETHCYNHHVHIGGPGDWSRPQNSGFGWGLIRCLRYAVMTAVRMGRGRRAPEARRITPRLRTRLRVEQSLLYPTAVIACALAPRIFLCFTLPTWIGGTVLFMGVNLLQHDECEPNSKIDHSRDFTSPLLNWFFFGGGFHTAHHLRPGVHWSELAELHARTVAPHKRADLTEYSMVGFLARHYLATHLSGGRHEPAES
jgi:fatty acid desaturase